MNTYVHVHTHTHIYIYIYTYTYRRIYIALPCVHRSVYKSIFVYIRVHLYVYIYIHPCKCGDICCLYGVQQRVNSNLCKGAVPIF